MRFSKHNKDAEHNKYGGVPWECAHTVFGQDVTHFNSGHRHVFTKQARTI